jgi:hypothetical protein
VGSLALDPGARVGSQQFINRPERILILGLVKTVLCGALGNELHDNMVTIPAHGPGAMHPPNHDSTPMRPRLSGWSVPDSRGLYFPAGAQIHGPQNLCRRARQA